VHIGRNKNPLLIDNNHHVGNSYITKVFAEQKYKSYIIIDFEMHHRIFQTYLSMIAMILTYSAFYSTKLYNRQFLIIFDEVQQYLRTR